LRTFAAYIFAAACLARKEYNESYVTRRHEMTIDYSINKNISETIFLKHGDKLFLIHNKNKNLHTKNYQTKMQGSD
jgi:hypothetical protein